MWLYNNINNGFYSGFHTPSFYLFQLDNLTQQHRINSCKICSNIVGFLFRLQSLTFFPAIGQASLRIQTVIEDYPNCYYVFNLGPAHVLLFLWPVQLSQNLLVVSMLSLVKLDRDFAICIGMIDGLSFVPMFGSVFLNVYIDVLY